LLFVCVGVCRICGGGAFGSCRGWRKSSRKVELSVELDLGLKSFGLGCRGVAMTGFLFLIWYMLVNRAWRKVLVV
jgi:hypothetical protein